MNKMMNQPDPQDSQRQSMLRKGERNKLIIMSVLLAAVGIAFITSQAQKSKHENAQQSLIEAEPEFVESVVVPEFKEAEAVAAMVLDNRPEDRVLLPAKVLDPFIEYSKGFSDAQFGALNPQVLTPELHAQISANPSAFRAKPYRIRGYLGDIKSHRRADGTTEYKGWLTTASGEVSHFIVTELADDPILDDFMRVDGLFVKLYRRKGLKGDWAEGPLFVGSRAVRSFAESEPYDPEVLAARLALIEDDSAKKTSGLDGLVFDAQWLLMDYAQDEAAASIDWEAENELKDWDGQGVLELNNETMVALLKDGDRFRGKPFRIPISKNMGIWTQDPGENPSRLDHVTTGWIGNWTWSNQAGVIKFIMPEYRPGFEDVELLTAKGFFLKSFNYEPLQGGTRQAPYFILTDLEEFIPQKNELAGNLMWVVVGITLLLVGLFPLLLFRDRKKSEALQRDLVRRKQERRRRLAAEQPQA